MRLIKLGCQYFGHFGKYTEIDIPEFANVIALIAQWAKNPLRSNQGGKSTFIEMIQYSLWGKGRLKKETELINKNFEEDMFVIAHYLLDDGTILKIKRGRRQNNAAILEVSGCEGGDKTDVQGIINDLVGMSYNDFVTICYFMQGDMHQFMDANSNQKKDYIIRWLESEYWDKFEDEVKNDLKITSKEIIRITERIEILNEELSNEAECEDINALNALKEKYGKRIRKYTKRLNNKRKKLTKLDEAKQLGLKRKELNEQIRMNNQLLDNLDSRIERGIKEVKRMKNELGIAEALKDEIAKSNYDKIEIHLKQIATKREELLSKKVKFEQSIETIEEQVEESLNGECPVTGKYCKKIDATEQIKKSKKQLKYTQEELDKVKKELSSLTEMRKQYESELNRKTKIEHKISVIQKANDPYRVQKEIQAIKEERRNIHQYVKELKGKMKIVLDKLSNIDISEYKGVQDEIRQTESKIDKYQHKLKNIEIRIGIADSILRRRNEAKEQLTDLNNKLIELREKETVQKFTAFMFGKSGIRSNQIESAFEEIEVDINYILSTIKSNMQVEFRAVKELSQWETHCPVCGEKFPSGRIYECVKCGKKKGKKKKDELSLKIYQKGKEYEFDGLSGGAKVLITLAVRVAIFRMLKRRANIKPKFMFFDEILAQLDEVNRQLVLELMVTVLIKELGVEQIFIISHQDIKDQVPYTILITRYDSFSDFKFI